MKLGVAARFLLARAAALTAMVGAVTATHAQPPVPHGPALQVNNHTTGSQYRGDVASGGGGRFVVVWQSFLEDGYGGGIFGRRFDAAGQPQGAPFQVNASTVGSELYPAVAVEPDGDFVVVWQVYGAGLTGRRFASSGAPLASEFAVNEFTPAQVARPAVAVDADGEFVAAWQAYGVDGSGWGIMARRFFSAGSTADFIVNDFFTSYQGKPAIASAADGRFVVVWESYGQDGSDYGVFGQRFASTGQRVGGEFRVNPVTADEQAFPAVAMDTDGDFIVVWQSRAGQDGSFYGVMARRYDSLGFPNDYELVVNSYTEGGQVFPDVSAEPDGDFVVSWISDGGGGPEAGTFLRRFNSLGVPQGPDLLVDTSNDTFSYPRVAATTHFLVVWSEPDGSDLGVFSRAFRGIATLDADGDGSFAALTDGLLILRFAFGFTGATLTSSAVSPSCTRCSAAPILGYLTSLAGAEPLPPSSPVPAGTEFQVNTYTTSVQAAESIAADADGDFVIVWRSRDQDGSGQGVFARRFASSGVALGQPFQVSTYTVGYQDSPDVALEPNGDFVVVWKAPGQAGSVTDVSGRRFASSGSPLAQEFRVNLHDGGQHELPTVAIDGDGDFVVAWSSTEQDGSATGIFARRFDSSGAALGGEFQVNTFTIVAQRYPAVAAEVNGDFIVVWTSNGQDGSPYSVFGQRFSSAGAPLGPDFEVNTVTVNSQLDPAVAADADGDFVVTWFSYAGEDGSGWSILGRSFDSSGAPRGPQFVASVETLNNQSFHDVAIGADGDFVITWRSPHGPESDVFARRFASTGAALTGDLQVNSYTTGSQSDPLVAADADGDFVVAWTSPHDGDPNGVFAQRFVAPTILDVDGNGSFGALTDGLLILRFAFGFTGATLIGGAVGPGCTRCDAPAIAAYIQTLV